MIRFSFLHNFILNIKKNVKAKNIKYNDAENIEIEKGVTVSV